MLFMIVLKLCKSMSIGGLHCRLVGGQNKRKFVHKLCIKMKVNSQRRKIVLGSLSIDVRETWTATGSRMLHFWCVFAPRNRWEKLLLDICDKCDVTNFRLLSSAHELLCLSSLLFLSTNMAAMA